MGEHESYAVFFHPAALDALGEAVKPYLTDGPAGPHVQCVGIDTGGAFCEMRLPDAARPGGSVELMVPTAMVRMIVSITDGQDAFGFA
jgi:hypothetical protein